MIVNPEKFKSIIQKSNQTVRNSFLIGSDVVEIASSMKLLDIHVNR